MDCFIYPLTILLLAYFDKLELLLDDINRCTLRVYKTYQQNLFLLRTICICFDNIYMATILINQPKMIVIRRLALIRLKSKRFDIPLKNRKIFMSFMYQIRR